ncbi:phosphatase 2C-like domain-containing protein [Amylostereum chailletii]|nr:phosphatase 2C-like domain-containing protein [Amylostereum chailletii]
MAFHSICPSSLRSILHSLKHKQRLAFYHDYVRYPTPGGIVRVPLSSSKVIGIANSRGTRAYQEDFNAFATLSIDPRELHLTVQRHLGIDWEPASADKSFANEVLFVGIYDGHGGSTVSQYLRQELHGLFESVHTSQIPELYEWIKEVGGYFKRFNGGILKPWIRPNGSQDLMDLHARATLAFFQIDRNLSEEPAAKLSGSTASVAILHSLDTPSAPFFSARKLALTVAHAGDTRVLLCSKDRGQVHAVTENHRAEARVESTRLRRMMGTGLITDSFGDARWMGVLQNTRSLGDLKWKPFGVTPEPDVRTKLLYGEEWAYMILVSDGISSLVSDQEIVDLARDARDPKDAADRISSFAENMGSDDNMTAIVLPLAGWGKVTGPDLTKQLREYRARQMSMTFRSSFQFKLISMCCSWC